MEWEITSLIVDSRCVDGSFLEKVRPLVAAGRSNHTPQTARLRVESLVLSEIVDSGVLDSGVLESGVLRTWMLD